MDLRFEAAAANEYAENTKNDGENWDVVKYFTDNSIKLYNLKFDTEYMYASTIEGLYKS